MFIEIKSILRRSSDDLLQDLAGAAALVFLLIVGLHLPGTT